MKENGGGRIASAAVLCAAPHVFLRRGRPLAGGMMLFQFAVRILTQKTGGKNVTDSL